MTHSTYQQLSQPSPAAAATSSSAAAARLDDEVISFATDLFSALAHPTRLRIVELLTISERTVNEIAHELDILQPNTSQHLAILQRAGVVRVTPRGALRSYSIRAPRMDQILQLADELRAGQVADDASPARDGHVGGSNGGRSSSASPRLIVRDNRQTGSREGHAAGPMAGVPARLLQSHRDGGTGVAHGSSNGKLHP